MRVGANFNGFARAAADLRAVLDTKGVQGRLRYQVELVFEEIVTNVIRHGYGGDSDHDIDVAIECGVDAVTLTFDDDGQPFDPLRQPAPAKPASLENARLGGLGIVLVRKAARDLRYIRTPDGKNRLTVTIAAK